TRRAQRPFRAEIPLTFRAAAVYSRVASSGRFPRPAFPECPVAGSRPNVLSGFVVPSEVAMSAPATTDQFLELLRKSGLLEERTLDAYITSVRAAPGLPASPKQLAQLMVNEGLLTEFQARQLLVGKSRGFTISGKYKLLEHLG